MGPTALFKAFLDRWYGARHSLTFAGRRVILVIPLEDTDVKTARHTVGMLSDVLAYLKMELFATLLAPGVLRRGEVRQRPDHLATARRAGREATASMKRKGKRLVKAVRDLFRLQDTGQ